MKGYHKITFDELLYPPLNRAYIFYLLQRILKHQSKYTKRIAVWTTTGISKELFGYSANEYSFEYNLIAASYTDLELLMYRFIYKNSPQLNLLRKKEFKKEFEKRYIYIKTNDDYISGEIINDIKSLNGKEIKNNSQNIHYYFNNITLFTTGDRFTLSYKIYYQTDDKKNNGYHCGDWLVQEDREKLSEFIKRGERWLKSKCEINQNI